MSTHYTHFDLTHFTINCLAVLGVVIPKLPWVCLIVEPSTIHPNLFQTHRMRIGFFSDPNDE